ncbi:MAG: methionyl-tRNA formyltransferase [Lachnospiraceae bacterium]|nr:methionyl-tRNA formyltransferase [Lachnospiraceae bacterium]
MKIVFMGTPDFAAAALRALIRAGHEITAVVTQPDKPKGRSKEPVPSPVKVCAVENGIPVLQPKRIKRPEATAELRGYAADVYIVAAFGQILSQEILDIPPLGSLNIHASLLPKYRGASPIQHAIIDGEERTGITIMQMDAGIDTGDMLYRKETAVLPQDNYETLHDRLAALGGEAIVEALALLEQGKLEPVKQDEGLSCYAPLIGKEMGEIDFTREAAAIDRQIRGMTPWPSAFTGYRGKQLKIWRAEPTVTENVYGRVPGEILRTDRDCITVAAGQGALRIYELQLAGKKRMAAHDFLLGVKMQPGEVLGGV